MWLKIFMSTNILFLLFQEWRTWSRNAWACVPTSAPHWRRSFNIHGLLFSTKNAPCLMKPPARAAKVYDNLMTLGYLTNLLCIVATSSRTGPSGRVCRGGKISCHSGFEVAPCLAWAVKHSSLKDFCSQKLIFQDQRLARTSSRLMPPGRGELLGNSGSVSQAYAGQYWEQGLPQCAPVLGWLRPSSLQRWAAAIAALVSS